MTTEQSAAPPASGGAARPLDDVMLAMDVVDTLRRRERLVERELDAAGREQDLKERLRRIYQAQGIEVPDRIIDEGVAALKEDRFVYDPPEPGFAVRLARLYVSRGKWGKWLLGGIAVLLLVWVVNVVFITGPARALPQRLAATHAEVLAAATTDDARGRAEALLGAGEAALSTGDTAAAQEALSALERLRGTLGQSYRLRIVNEPGEPSGIWRIPDANAEARNYYVVVETIGPTGQPVRVPVTNEETGKTEQVSKWALRVDKRTFEQVARDKQDDGIIQRNHAGEKRSGHLTPDYTLPTTGAAITQW
jgi:hypothetical protein